MTKVEIVVLIITIFVSVTLLAFFLDKVFKTKKEKSKKQEKKEEKIEKVTETNNESDSKKEAEITQNVPEVSIALQDELNEFKEYLKTRIAPETVTEEEKYKHSYDTPKFNRYGDFDFDDIDKDYDFPFRKKSESKTKYETLPDDVKILLFTDFFDTKF